MASSASSASSLNFTTRQLDVQLDTQEFQVNLERFQQLIESGLSIMFSKDSLALHLNEPLEAQNRAEQLKALSFQGRDPMVEEPSGIDNPPSTITWMELIHEVQSHKFKPDLTCNVVYGCHYKGKIIKILEKDKKKIEELQVLSTEKLAFQHDIVKERKVAAEMLSRVNNVAETFQSKLALYSPLAVLIIPRLKGYRILNWITFPRNHRSNRRVQTSAWRPHPTMSK
ncbi:hypothetical protein N7488_003863 [Penicillium malachiteum]|nr:hypothetical protein N7488_003863 [Penicillium malachiteum]